MVQDLPLLQINLIPELRQIVVVAGSCGVTWMIDLLLLLSTLKHWGRIVLSLLSKVSSRWLAECFRRTCVFFLQSQCGMLSYLVFSKLNGYTQNEFLILSFLICTWAQCSWAMFTLGFRLFGLFPDPLLPSQIVFTSTMIIIWFICSFPVSLE